MKKSLHLPLISIVVISINLMMSCSKSNNSPDNTQNTTTTPTISTISASTGPYNTPVTITGSNFSSSLADDQVSFNGVTAVVSAATSTQLIVTVPKGAGTGPISVNVKGSISTGPVFTYQLSAVVTTIAGGNTYALIDGPIATATFGALWGIVKDASGNIFVTQNSVIRKIAIDNNVSTFAGSISTNGVFTIKDGKGVAATFYYPTGMAIDAANIIYVADNDRIRKILSDGTVTTIAQIPGADIVAVAVDASGNVYAADLNNNLIKKITSTGIVSTFAGNGSVGTVNGLGIAASFNQPIGLTIDASGNLFVVDESSNLIRKISPAGLVTTIAGNGTKGSTNGQALSASFNNPTGIAVDAAGNLYIGDYDNNLIRKINTDGVVSTLAGSGIQKSVDGTGVNASFLGPQDLIVDGTGTIYVAEGGHIRKIVLI